MHAALSISEIEKHVRDEAYYGNRHSLCILFSPYNREKAGANFEFLTRVQDYHFHSGKHLACYCAGYSVYEPSASRVPNIALSERFWPLAFFYPELFHEIRGFVGRKLKHEWRFTGGVDLLLFPIDQENDRAIKWDRAAYFVSRRLMPAPFSDVDELVRTVFAMAESSDQGIVPSDADREIAKMKFVANVKAFGGKAAGGLGNVAGAAIGLAG